MKENEFFIEILKETPSNSFIETSGFVDYYSAEKLGLIKFKEFKPDSVGLAFEFTDENRNDWIEYFTSIDITVVLTHYWIYHKDLIIGNGFDFFEINTFDKNYYKDKFKKFAKDFEIHFVKNLSNGLPEPKRLIKILATHEFNNNFSLDIATNIAKRNLKLRFAIDKEDYDNLTKLFNEINSDFRLEFQGVYLVQADKIKCGLTMIRNSYKIDLTVVTTKKFVSNLLWFQQLNNEKEIEKMII